MKKKELEDKINNPFGQVNLEEVVKNSAEKAITSVAEKEFKGFVVQGYQN